MPVTKDLNKRSLVGRIQSLETGYLGAVRAALAAAVLIGILALAAAVAIYLFGLLATAGGHSADRHFEAPTWESIRPQVLPMLSAAPTSATEEAAADKAPPGRSKSLDPRILQIAEHLNAQFSRNTGNETYFTDRFPRRLLESWIMEESVPPAFLDDYVGELVSVAEAIGSDGRINRIGALDDRAAIIMEALQAFNQAFLANMDTAERQARAAQAAAEEQRAAAGSAALFLGLGGLGLLVSILLIVILIRIEAHLQDQVRLQRQAIEDARQIVPVLCVIGCAVLALAGAQPVEAATGSSEAGSFNGCDWTIASDAGDRAGQSREEVADQLAEELAIKLRQFDECAERLETAQANANSGAVGGGGGQGRNGSGSGGGTSGTGEEGADEEQVAQGEPNDAETDRQRTDGAADPTASRQSTTPNVESVEGRSGGRPRISSKEDDIARILREAAEKETDPDRQAALWQEYENYVKSL